MTKYFYSANFKTSNNAFIYSERQNYSILNRTGDNPDFNQSRPNLVYCDWWTHLSI